MFQDKEAAQSRATELRAQIKTLQDELTEVEKISNRPTPKPMKRSDFDQLDGMARAQHIADGGTLYD